ncbi:MAG: metal ABC transporter permease [Gammaproteobacteria bacterium]
MAEFFTALLNYNFLQYALVAGLLASVGCGVIGTLVVVRRISFLAGGIAHAVLGGMGIVYFFGGQPLYGALPAALIAALLIALINRRFKAHEDTLVAALWSVGIAVGMIFITRTPGYSVDLLGYLFGNILLVTRADLLLMLILDISILLLVGLYYKPLLASCFDEEFARLRGVPVELFHVLLLCMVALTVVLLVKVVGLILVMALLTLPAAAAMQFSRSLLHIMGLAVVFGSLICSAGLAVSYAPDLPAGATIVIVAAVFYALCLGVHYLMQRQTAEISRSG